MGHADRRFGLGPGLIHDLGQRLIAGWTGYREVHAKARRGVDQRVRDVVAVTQKSELDAGDRAQLFLNREAVGQPLARMEPVGQAVNDGDRSLPRQSDNHVVRERPRHDSVDQSLQVPRGVGDRLAHAHVDVVGAKENGVPAELGHPRLECDARAQARFLENHGECFARQRRERLLLLEPRFELRRQRQNFLNLFPGQIENRYDIFIVELAPHLVCLTSVFYLSIHFIHLKG